MILPRSEVSPRSPRPARSSIDRDSARHWLAHLGLIVRPHSARFAFRVAVDGFAPPRISLSHSRCPARPSRHVVHSARDMMSFSGSAACRRARPEPSSARSHHHPHRRAMTMIDAATRDRRARTPTARAISTRRSNRRPQQATSHRWRQSTSGWWPRDSNCRVRVDSTAVRPTACSPHRWRVRRDWIVMRSDSAHRDPVRWVNCVKPAWCSSVPSGECARTT